MKYFLFFTVLIFFVFSCAGGPRGDKFFMSPEFDEIYDEEDEETFDYSLLEDIDSDLAYDEETFDDPLEDIDTTPVYDEELTDKDLPDEELFAEDSLVEDSYIDDLYTFVEPEEIVETGADIEDFLVDESPQQDEGLLAAIDEEEIDEDEAVLIPDTELVEIPQVVQTPLIQQPPSIPVLQTPPQQPPAPVPPSSPPSSQTPPVPPPALLGPAEQRPGTGREDSTRAEPRRDSSFDEREQPVTPSQSVIVPQNDEIIFSRIVRATVGQTVEIPFRGTGWVYLGELASRRGIVYSSRRLDPEGQSFIFTTEEAGTYTLKFFKQDFIRDYILNDHVQVIVGEAPTAGSGWFNPPAEQGRIVAQPRWPSAEEEAEILRGGSMPGASRSGANTPPVNIPDREVGTISMPETVPSRESAQDRRTTAASEIASTQGTPPVSGASVPNTSVSGLPSTPQQPVTELPSASALPQPPASQEALPPGVLLQRAKETFDGGNVAAAIALLDQYAEYYPGGTDELYWFYGQFYEANSPSRNILLSLDYYRRLMNEYPQSSRYNDARRRIAYLERFYINIQ